MNACFRSRHFLFSELTFAAALAGCAVGVTDPAVQLKNRAVDDRNLQANQLINRVTWGIDSTSIKEMQTLGVARLRRSVASSAHRARRGRAEPDAWYRSRFATVSAAHY